MLIVLPLLCFLALVVALLRRGWAAGPGDACLKSALLWGCLVTGITEGLGYCRLLTTGPVAALWSVATLTALAIALWRRPEEVPWRGGLWRPETLSDWSLLGGIVTVLALTGLTALWAAPTNYDSMTYHLVRIGYWMQQRDLAFFPTHIRRQLHLAPWSEFTLLNLILLTGSDRLVNLVQWFSLAGCTLGSGLIARQLGGPPRAQLLAGLLTTTLPMAVLQASSTQTDLVGSFWLVCLVYHLLQLLAAPRLSLCLAAGVSLGLAVLTKGTGYVFAAPLLAWFLGALRSRRALPFRRLAAASLLAGVAALGLNSPFYIRNYNFYGNPLGPEGEDPPEAAFKFRNDGLSWKYLASNAVRNLGIALATDVDRLNTRIDRAARAIHHGLGLAIDDPHCTWPYCQFGVGGAHHLPKRHEDLAANSSHLVLFLFLGVGAIVRGRVLPGPRRLRWAGPWSGGFFSSPGCSAGSPGTTV
jgi:hypothetical protein